MTTPNHTDAGAAAKPMMPAAENAALIIVTALAEIPQLAAAAAANRANRLFTQRV
ncbi:hypothetical protein M1D93_15045 [Arthrobacter sp. Z1-9]